MRCPRAASFELCKIPESSSMCEPGEDPILSQQLYAFEQLMAKFARTMILYRCMIFNFGKQKQSGNLKEW